MEKVLGGRILPNKEAKEPEKPVSKAGSRDKSKVIDAHEEYFCGNINLHGTVCKAPVVYKGKCHVHKDVTIPDRGFYSNCLSAEERMIWDNVPVGELSNEIRVNKLRLRRLLETSVKKDKDLSVVRKITTLSDNGGEDVQVIEERPDYEGQIDRLSGTITRLEKTRAEIHHMVTSVHDEGVSGFRNRLEQMEAQADGEQTDV